jgi:hypothetical protein
MTQLRDLNSGTQKLEAYPVSHHARMGTLPRHFGRHMMTVEHKIYNLMGRFVADYKGAFWEFYELSNGGMYMAPRIPSVRLSIQSNGFQGQMSADAAGITVCLFAFSLLSFEGNDEVFARHFHWLREFALGHAEATQIFAAID